MSLRLTCGYLAIAGLLSFNSSAIAQQQQEDQQNFTVDVGGELRAVENANLAPADEAKIDEAQFDVNLAAFGRLENSWSYLVSDLSLEARFYEEQTERDERLFIGELLYHLGSESSPIALELEYSAEEIAIDPTLVDIPINRDSRNIASAALLGNTRLGQSNTLSARLQVSEVQFTDFNQNDSTRTGATVRLSRRVSPLFNTSLELAAQRADYEFDDRQSDYYSAVWQNAWALRRTFYQLDVGQDWVETNSETTHSFNGRALVGANVGLHDVRFEARQWLADTSIGDGNAMGFDDLVGQDGRLGVVDQFVNREGSLRLASRGVCRRCDVTASLLFREEDYQVFSEFDTTELNASLLGNYRAGQTWSLYASVTGADVTFAEDPASDYQDQRLELGLVSVYFRDLELTAMLNYRERSNGQGGRNADATYLGVAASYQLYRR